MDTSKADFHYLFNLLLFHTLNKPENLSLLPQRMFLFSPPEPVHAIMLVYVRALYNNCFISPTSAQY